MDRIAALEKEVAELKAMLAASAPSEKLNRRSAAYQNANRQSESPGPYGDAIAAHEAWLQRQAAERKRREELAAEQLRRATEGLPEGYYRDPCGIVRNRETGAIAEVDMRQKEAIAAIEATMAEEQRTRLASGLTDEQLFDQPVRRPRHRGRGRKGSKGNGN